MIFNSRLKEENKRLKGELESLDLRVWKLENKPKYAVGVLLTSNNSYITEIGISSKHFKDRIFS